MPYLKVDGSLAAETPTAARNNYGTTLGGETLTGSSLADALWGQGDNDLLIGGGGGDTYYLNSATARIQALTAGAPNQIVSWANTKLDSYEGVQNLAVGGDRTYGAGDEKDNIVVATGSRQQLYGGKGQDVLVGNGQADTFIVVKGEGNDAIYGFNAARDVVRLSSGYDSFAELKAHLSQVGADVKLDLGGGDALVLRNLQATALTAANFQLGLDPAKLGSVTFKDDFNSLSLWKGGAGTWSTTYWYDNPAGNGGTLTGNNEQQWYINANYAPTASVTPWTVSGGQLTLTAAPATPEISALINGYKYTSGEINTYPTFAQTYGYFEMRADVPEAAGAWPAFWLIPADGSWPPELDVMEVLTHDPNAVWTTAHSNASGSHTMSQAMSFIPDTADGFHTYGVLWTKQELAWFIDGVEVFRTATPADMHKPMYMMANVALGGWGGAIVNADLPAQMKVDYIRAYGLADGSSTVISKLPTPEAEPQPTPTPQPQPKPEPPPPEAPAGLTLTSTQAGSVLTGGAGADTLIASPGRDTLTGGAGADHFVFGKEPWAPVHINDFEVGVDVLDLSALFAKSGYAGADPVADKYVYFESDGQGGTMLRFDRDGVGTAQQWPNTIIRLKNLSPVNLDWQDLQGAPPPPPAPPPEPEPPGVLLTSTKVGSVLVGGAGADTLNASQGSDTLTGGAGADAFVFGKEPWSPVRITDFQVGLDELDLTALFARSGYVGSDPVADKYVYFESDGQGGTMVRFDRDAGGTAQLWPNTIIRLEHVSPTELTWAKLQGEGWIGQ